MAMAPVMVRAMAGAHDRGHGPLALVMASAVGAGLGMALTMAQGIALVMAMVQGPR